MTLKRNLGLSLLLAIPAVAHSEESKNQPAPKQQNKADQSIDAVNLAYLFDLVLKGIDFAKVESDPELEGGTSTLQMQ